MRPPPVLWDPPKGYPNNFLEKLQRFNHVDTFPLCKLFPKNNLFFKYFFCFEREFWGFGFFFGDRF
jgi:hypothetical protein